MIGNGMTFASSRVAMAVEKRSLRKVVSGAVLALGLLLFKLKGFILLIAAKFKPLFVNPFEGFGVAQLWTAGVSMVVSLFAYAVKWGFWFGLGLVLLILIHELGHAIVIRAKGLRAGAMVFIPFIGGAVTLKDQPRSVYVDAQIGLAGPILGTIAAFVALGLYQWTGLGLYLGIAYAGFIINLLNLMPIGPLDGGRIAAAITKWIWVLGVVIVFFVMVWQRNPLLLLILILGIFQIGKAIRGPKDDTFYNITPLQRTLVAVVYFLLVLLVGYESLVTHWEVERLLTQ